MDLNLKPIGEHSYSFMDGFALCADKPMCKGGMRQIDWEAVKALIESGEFDRIEVGLAEDYYQTHAVVFAEGKVKITENDGAGFYGCSRWATPAVKLAKDGKTELFECWIPGKESKFPKWLKEASHGQGQTS